MIFSSSCPASWLLKQFEIAIWLFLCQLLPLCHLVKAPNPWCGEQGLWWLTWPLCSLVGSSTTSPLPLNPPPSHCAPSVWGASAPAASKAASVTLLLPAPPHEGSSLRGVLPAALELVLPCLLHPGPQSRMRAFLHFRACVGGLSVSAVHVPRVTEPCLPTLRVLTCQHVCLLVQTVSAL